MKKKIIIISCIAAAAVLTAALVINAGRISDQARNDIQAAVSSEETKDTPGLSEADKQSPDTSEKIEKSADDPASKSKENAKDTKSKETSPAPVSSSKKKESGSSDNKKEKDSGSNKDKNAAVSAEKKDGQKDPAGTDDKSAEDPAGSGGAQSASDQPQVTSAPDNDQETTPGSDGGNAPGEKTAPTKTPSKEEKTEKKDTPAPTKKPENEPAKAPTEIPAEVPTEAPTKAPAPEKTPEPTPVPTETPAPTPAPEIHYCSISIDCNDILAHEDLFEGDWNAVGNGVILGTSEIEIYEGDTVYNVLERACGSFGIALNSRESSYGSYVAGIAGIYEFDAGPTSGWTYYVNGEWATVSSSDYGVSPGDSIVWTYSCSW